MQPTFDSNTQLVNRIRDLEFELKAEMLKNLGYEVHNVSNGKEAVEYYKTHCKEIDLVILDMIMPEMDGNATFDRLKDMDPELSVGFVE